MVQHISKYPAMVLRTMSTLGPEPALTKDMFYLSFLKNTGKESFLIPFDINLAE